ncbi:plasmid stabilization protein, partial [Clostridium botulinum]|nr:plasmid stabilization protein [Clostridium botulinum]
TYNQVARTAEDITSIKSDMNTVEAVTAKNWQDIAKLKAIK